MIRWENGCTLEPQCVPVCSRDIKMRDVVINTVNGHYENVQGTTVWQTVCYTMKSRLYLLLLYLKIAWYKHSIIKFLHLLYTCFSLCSSLGTVTSFIIFNECTKNNFWQSFYPLMLLITQHMQFPFYWNKYNWKL